MRLCPIDGDLGRTHGPAPRLDQELRRLARSLSESLEAAGHGGWANLFKKAVRAADDDFLVLLGHSVAVLLRHGPVADLQLARTEVEQLLVDVVAIWSPRGR